MKNSLKYFILIGLIFSMLIPKSVIHSQENITPMEKVEWIEEKPAEETSQEAEVSSNEDSGEIEETQDNNEETNQELINEQGIVEIDTSSYAAFVESLMKAETKAFEYVSFVSEGEALTALSHSIVKNGPFYYLTQLYPPFLPTTQVIKSDRDTVETGYLSVDDLMINAADGLNQQPQIYAGTVVEEFYVYAQENYQELEGKYIEVPVDQLQLADVSLEMFKLEELMNQILSEWLEQDIVLNSFMETELGYQVDIVGEAGELFNQLIQEYGQNYPELQEFLSEYPNGFQGTVMINYDNYLIGLGLIAEANDTYAAGSEIYMEYRQPTELDITEDSVITYDEFVNQVGYDIIAEINAFEANLTADQFVSPEEE